MTWANSITTPTAGLNVPISWFQGVTGNLNHMAAATYTPVLTASTTNPTLGSGSAVSGSYVRVAERLIVCSASIQFGTSGTASGSGTYRVSLPVSIDAAWNGPLIGCAWLNNTGTNYLRNVFGSSTYVEMWDDAAATVTHTAPFGWGVSDFMKLMFVYYAAS